MKYGTNLATIESESDNTHVLNACKAIAQPRSVPHCWIGLQRPFMFVRYILGFFFIFFIFVCYVFNIKQKGNGMMEQMLRKNLIIGFLENQIIKMRN